MPMTFEECAQKLAEKGFYIFPVRPNSKLPAIKDFPNIATRSIATIDKWWTENPSYNVGISTSKFRDDEALVVIDVDNKGDKKGDDEVFRLELEGKEFPETLEQRTPTGGRHFIYSTPLPLRQGTKVFGTTSIDTRSKGGYIVGAGSTLDGRPYVSDGRSVAAAPQWIVNECGKPRVRDPLSPSVVEGVDPERAKARAIKYLSEEAQYSVQGMGGDQSAFHVACQVKDCGVDIKTAFELMSDLWNERCSPPWSLDELQKKVCNAYAYGLEPIGSNAPEAQFPPIEPEPEKLDPIAEMNKEYAYIGSEKGFIFKEKTDSSGRYKRVAIKVPVFHQNLLPKTMNYGDRTVQISKEWIKSPRRRSYDDVCFSPGKDTDPSLYNLWRGFAVEPASDLSPSTSFQYRSLKLFLEHALVNVCGGNADLNRWLIGYFAHLVQRPWEKPLVALVLHGRKGVGKNALIERVGHLLGRHFVTVTKKRHLLGDFNSLLEDKLMMVFDEAFWSGDHDAEGVLKGLITGNEHIIERKGYEAYPVDNLLRVGILGNEPWLVPASDDERRYAVFNVGDGRKQDRNFFKDMRTGMEAGGYSLLLRYLLDFDIAGIDVDQAPQTKGLVEQKIQTLDALGQWWRESLIEGHLLGADFGGGWPREVSKKGAREAYQRFVTSRSLGGRGSSVVSESHFSRSLKKYSPSMTCGRKRLEGGHPYVFSFSALSGVREEWKSYCGELIENEDEIL